VLFKWILYLALAVLVAWAIWKNRAELLAALRDFRQMLADFWNKLFGGKAREAKQVAAEEASKARPLPRFANFTDLAGEVSSLGDDARLLADLYCQVAYAHGTPPAAGVTRLSQLWQEMRAAIAPSFVVPPSGGGSARKTG
jgi:hypothetical protein